MNGEHENGNATGSGARMEQALRASELSYRRLFESAQDGILILDVDTGHINDVNPFLVKLLGYPHGEMVGKTVGELSPFKDIVANQDILKRLQKDGYVRYHDLPLETRDGRKIAVEFVSNVYQAGDKKVIQCNIRDITGRKQAEATLKATETRYRRLFEAAQDGILILDGDTGQVVDANPFMKDLLGYSQEEFLGRKLWEIGPFKGEAASKITFAELQHADCLRYEGLPLEAKDGRRIEVEFISNAYLVGHKRLIQCNIRDITERKQAEKARRASEKRLREVTALQELLLSPNPIEQRLKLVTEAVVRIMGADFARIWMIAPGDRCAAGCVHARATEGPHVCRFREQCLHLLASSGRYTHTNGDHGRVPLGCYKIGKIASGEASKFLTNEVTTDPRVHNHAWAKELGLVSFAGYRLVDTGGAPLGVLALFSKRAILAEEDSLLEGIAHITAQVLHSGRAEASLRDSESRYRALFEGSADGIVIADGETKKFKYANPALCRMLGYTEAELLNLGVMDIHPKESVQHVMAEFEAQARGDKTLAELPCLRKDGSVFHADISAVKITIENRPCNVGFFRDITERKRTEAALRSGEERFRIAAETANDAIYEWDLKQSVEWWGKIDEMLGYEPGEFPRTLDDWAASVHPEDLESTMAAIQAQLEGRAPYAVEYRVRRKDGVYRWWSAHSRPDAGWKTHPIDRLGHGHHRAQAGGS
jgi:PAS domain S-box-containing protein